MSSPTQAETTQDAAVASVTVRQAELSDLQAAVGAVRALLVELGGTPPTDEAMARATRELIEQPDSGVLLLAERDGELVGVAAASFQLAIHTAGRYALLQDLWVKPRQRSGSIGAQLIAALCEHARALGMPRIEVGLPSESFPRLQATTAFYERNGFKPLGPRMRLMLA